MDGRNIQSFVFTEKGNPLYLEEMGTYCIHSHVAAARRAGMSDAMLAELLAVVGMANETNRLVAGYQIEVDPQFSLALE